MDTYLKTKIAQILDREDGWFERAVKEAICVQVENSSQAQSVSQDKDHFTVHIRPVYCPLMSLYRSGMKQNHPGG